MARELGHPDAQKLLSGSLARLAYNGHVGFPRLCLSGSTGPANVYWTGERILVCTAPTSPKVRALSSRPEVVLTIDSGTTPEEAKALLVRGLATTETVDGVPEYIAAATKSFEESELAEFERNVRSVYKQMVRISTRSQLRSVKRATSTSVFPRQRSEVCTLATRSAARI